MEHPDTRHVDLALCAVGRKGLRVLERAIDACPPHVVIAYPQDGDTDGSFGRMRALCTRTGIGFVEARRVRAETIHDADLVALVPPSSDGSTC